MSDQTAGSSEPFCYISVEPNPAGYRLKRPWFWFRGRKALNLGVIVNHGRFPLYHVDTWFSPASAERNPDNPAYWALRSLKVVWPLLHKGRFRIGKEIPPGDYLIEYNCRSEQGESLFFVEHLVVGDRGVVIDVYKNGNELVFHMEQALSA